MCELFALSASAPVNVRLSLGVLARHGGETGIHADGWGVAFLEGRDVRLFRDTEPAARSPWLSYLQSNTIRSRAVVAHIRHATRGGVELANTQPFVRELGGCMSVFAHNGTLPGLEQESLEGSRFQPVGATDSERAFCKLLNKVSAMSRATSSDSVRIFAELAVELQELGPANLIWAMADRVLAFADRRTQASGIIAPPGLWMLQRHCSEPDTELAAAGVELASPVQTSVALLASVPLTSEPWKPLPQGTVLMLLRGEVEEMRAAR